MARVSENSYYNPSDFTFAFRFDLEIKMLSTQLPDRPGRFRLDLVPGRSGGSGSLRVTDAICRESPSDFLLVAIVRRPALKYGGADKKGLTRIGTL
jgi:hypothetical protein